MSHNAQAVVPGEPLTDGATAASSDHSEETVDSWEVADDGLEVTGSDLAHLRFLLTGSTASSPRWRKRLWASSIVVCALASSILALAATDPILIGPSSAWRRLGYLAAMTWPACGWIAAEITMLMEKTLPKPLADRSLLSGDDCAEPGGITGDSSHHALSGPEHPMAHTYVSGSDRLIKDRFMGSLLQTRVTPKCAWRVRRYSRAAAFLMLGPFGILLYFIVVLGWQARALHSAQNDLALVFACLSWPPAWLQLAGWLVYLQVPAAIGCDWIKQSTQHIRHMACSSSRNWNQAMSHLQSAHETTLCLSALLTPVMIANMFISSGFIVLWIGAVLAPRNMVPEGSWVQVWAPQWVIYLAIVCFYINATLPLFVGARCSSACDELVDAIASLR
eukprot:COSAG02_NODE_1165_length_14156_cov_58.567191_2_plen_391_part_00